jgi:hypothetical protein
VNRKQCKLQDELNKKEKEFSTAPSRGKRGTFENLGFSSSNNIRFRKGLLKSFLF